MTRWCLLAVVSMGLLAPVARAAEQGFSFNDKAGEYLDVLLDGKVAARYMYAHDTSTKDRRVETYKPYLHVFDADGKAPITQGAGGKQFPHHRGIYIGWKKMASGGKTYNFWEMSSGDIVHVKFAEQKADANSATITSLTRWVPDGSPDKAVIEEERTMTFRRGPAPARLIVDFSSKLKAPSGDVALEADPEHGGVQYRPHGDLDAKQTTYLFPGKNADAKKKDADFPWVGMSYTLGGKRYSVVDVNHPANPKETRWSAYRDYGRFGAYPRAELKSGETLTVQYRFLIADGEMLPADVIQKSADEFTGATAPTAVPKTTSKQADGAKPAAAPKKADAAK